MSRLEQPPCRGPHGWPKPQVTHSCDRCGTDVCDECVTNDAEENDVCKACLKDAELAQP